MKTYITFGQDLQFFQPSFAGKKVKRNLRPRKNTETYRVSQKKVSLKSKFFLQKVMVRD